MLRKYLSMNKTINIIVYVKQLECASGYLSIYYYMQIHQTSIYGICYNKKCKK